jgi:putative hydrolase of the HAD superfamily
MNIKAIIFDVGGVLHSSENEHVFTDIKQTLKITDDVFQQHYGPLVDRASLGEITEEEFWKQFLEATGSKESLPEESLFLREFEKRFKAFDDVLELVGKLKTAGYKLAVLSDTIPTHWKLNTERGLYKDFPVHVFSFQVGFKKPNREIFDYAIEKLGIQPGEGIFIDDLPANIAAAQSVGLQGIQFQNFDQLTQELATLGVRY